MEGNGIEEGCSSDEIVFDLATDVKFELCVIDLNVGECLT